MLLAALFASISATLIVYIVFFYIIRRQSIHERLTTAKSSQTSSNSLVKKDNLSEIDSLRRVLKSYAPSRDLALRLRVTGLKINVSAFYLICVVIFLVSFAIAHIHFKMIPSFVIAALGAAIPFSLIYILHQRYLNKFAEYLPSALSAISSAVKVGHSLQQALQSVVQTAIYPVNEEFRLVLNEISLGQTLDKALENLYERMRNPDLRILIVGIAIQQELGGNLSEIIENLEKTIRERFALLREIKALSAQGNMSFWVLLFIPPALMGIYFWSSRNLMLGFIQSSFGKSILGICILMQIIGAIGMRQVIRLKD